MKATLFVMPGSHPSMAARLMLELKGIGYTRIDVAPVIAKAAVRAARFPGVTVPALILDGERIQGTGAIARALDAAVPEPPLLPADGDERARVEAAERWGDETLQQLARRITWNVISRNRAVLRSYSEGARLGIPIGLAVRTAAPLVYLSKRFNSADDDHVRRDLESLPDAVARADAYLADGTIGGTTPNAADFQIATSLRLLMTLDDVRPAFDGHPCGEFALRLVPDFPGYAPSALPEDWKRALSEPAGATA